MSVLGRKAGASPVVAGFAAGAAIALLVGLMATINLQYGAPWAGTHTLSAQVADADSIAVGSDVRIAGRLAGQVVSVDAARGHAVVTFHVDGEDWPLPGDTTASVRLATLLGQKYIQLDPGHSPRMLDDGGTIGLSRTSPVVDFDQVLDTFDAPTRDALTSFIRTAAGAVAGQEGTLQQIAPTLSDLAITSGVPTAELVTRDPELNRVLINLGITSVALDRARDDLAGDIDSLNTLTAALSSGGGGALKGFIENTDALDVTTGAVLGGGYAAKLDTGLRRLSTFSDELNSLLATLIPETSSFVDVPPGTTPSDCRGGPYSNPCTPAQASINLIYEIGSATSQSDVPGSPGNFFLRQNLQGVDPCGLVPCNGVTPASGPTAAPPAVPSPLAPPILPNLPLPCLPPLVVAGCSGGGHPGPGPAPPPTVPPLPSLPLSIGYAVRDPAPSAGQGEFPERYR